MRYSGYYRGKWFIVSQGGVLSDPLGLALAPNHHLVTANGNGRQSGRRLIQIPANRWRSSLSTTPEDHRREQAHYLACLLLPTESILWMTLRRRFILRH